MRVRDDEVKGTGDRNGHELRGEELSVKCLLCEKVCVRVKTMSPHKKS